MDNSDLFLIDAINNLSKCVEILRHHCNIVSIQYVGAFANVQTNIAKLLEIAEQRKKLS